MRILRKPPTARALLIGFAATEDAGNCVAAIIGAGIIPGGMEMMDRPAIHAAEDFVHAGYPRDVEALLIVELDGPEAEVDHLIAKVEEIARANRAGVDPHQPERGRAARVLGRAQGGVPGGRPHLARLLLHGRHDPARPPRRRCWRRSRELSEQYGLRVANVFHAGDGNLHPLILYDANQPGEIEKAEAFGADILRLCVEVGGVLTGEHGVGVEKRDLMGEMFDETDLAHQQRLKCAFDPDGLLNPGKVFPTLAPLRRTGPAARPSRTAAAPRPAAFLREDRSEFRRDCFVAALLAMTRSLVIASEAKQSRRNVLSAEPGTAVRHGSGAARRSWSAG